MGDKTIRRGAIPSINNLTGLVVSYNQGCVRTAVESIRRFYPELPLIVVDGSSEKRVRKFFDNLDNCHRIYVDFNISHGRGLHLGITIAPTDYVLCFDTDIEMFEPCVEKMLELFEEDTLMVGKTVKIKQHIYAIRLKTEESVLYMYPHFHIVRRHNYRRYYPYLHSASPGQILFPYLTNENLTHVLKEFDVGECVVHNKGITSDDSPKSHLDNWILQTDFFEERWKT